MGAQLSGLKKDFKEILPESSDRLLRSLHILGHYAIIPAIYVYGLVQANEFTCNPFTILDKVLVA
jgi:hypothetical protein